MRQLLNKYFVNPQREYIVYFQLISDTIRQKKKKKKNPPSQTSNILFYLSMYYLHHNPNSGDSAHERQGTPMLNEMIRS